MKPAIRENAYGIVVPSVWHHMQCRDCLRFFAVEDAPASRKHWHCPWCGDHQEMREAA
jgi:sarcosine oxidase delta subunit